MLKATVRHPYRPAHVHFMISAPGHETLVTHVFAEGDPYLDSDAVFAAKSSLMRKFTHEPPGSTPDGQRMDTGWRRLGYDFGLVPQEQPAAAAE
jgi:hydroxyquinol 1,2-dioxygenase